LFLDGYKLRKNNYNTDGILELIILSYMFPYPIVIYDNYNVVRYIFSSGPVSVNQKTIEKYTSSSMLNKTIYMENQKLLMNMLKIIKK
jgi:nucleosome binding factor SPN SPT16 subunit